jgi:hypothetical protein
MSESEHGPKSGKEAAMRLLLGELGPLFDKAETAGNTLKEAHDLIQNDLMEFGQLVTRVEKTISDTMDQATYLIDRTKELHHPPAATTGRKTAPSPSPQKVPIAAIFICSLLSAALAVSGVVLFNLTTIEHARIGRAVSNAVKHLDAGTKQKLESAIQKAGSQ